MTALPSPATTAKAEFERRREAWRRAPGGIETPQAQANLHLWLAIACAAGCADRQAWLDNAAAGGDPESNPYLPELEWFRADRIYPPRDSSLTASGSAAIGQQEMPVYPHHIAPREQWQAELARARDTLLARAWHPDATAEQRTRAAAVAELARTLNTPLHRTEERKAA